MSVFAVRNDGRVEAHALICAVAKLGHDASQVAGGAAQQILVEAWRAADADLDEVVSLLHARCGCARGHRRTQSTRTHHAPSRREQGRVSLIPGTHYGCSQPARNRGTGHLRTCTCLLITSASMRPFSPA
jgi:hypothetical protein